MRICSILRSRSAASWAAVIALVAGASAFSACEGPEGPAPLPIAGRTARTKAGAGGNAAYTAGKSGAGNGAASKPSEAEAGSTSTPATAAQGGNTATSTSPATATGGAGTAADADANANAGQGGQGSPPETGGAGSPAKPANFVEACVDKEGMNACDGATLYHCGADGAGERPTTCATAARCKAGLTTGECGECDPGKFQCTEAGVLQECGETGTWGKDMPCPSKELCSVVNRTCDPSACAADAYHCEGDQLQKCKADFTGFEPVPPTCDPGMCNEVKGHCNECVPDSKECDKAGATILTCTADGELMPPQACSGNTPYCLNAKCVQCKSTNDCTSTNTCRPAACDAASGQCVTSFARLKTPCSENGGKVCDLTGNCVRCVDDRDCAANERCSPLNILNPCIPRNPLELAPSLLPGAYTLTLNAGWDLTIIKAAPELQGKVRVTDANSPLTSLCPTLQSCSIRGTGQARRINVTGPNASGCPNGGLLGQANETITLWFNVAPQPPFGSSEPAPDAQCVELTFNATMSR